jgi:hypothetical protein
MRLQPILCLLLFVAIYAGLHGGVYFFKNRLQELGIFFTLLMFAAAAWQSLFRLDQAIWKKWVYRPTTLTLGIMIGWALVFSLRYGTNALFSFFASREYFFIFLAPAIYLLWRNGLDVIWIRRIVWFSFFFLMINYLFFYSTLDLEAAFFSGDPYLTTFVTMDDWRGFRLKPPLFAIMVAILMSIMMMFSRISRWHTLAAIITFSIGAYIWSIVQFRSTLASMVLACMLYPFLTAHYNRLPLLISSIPVGIVVIYALVEVLMAGEGISAAGDDVRAKAIAAAIKSIAQQPLWGAGQESAFTISYQQLMGRKFFPDDIGLVGITYQYGFIGLALYLYVHFLILYRTWKTNWEYRQIVGRHEPLIWGLFMWMCAQTFNLVLNPGLSSAKGITVAAIAFALCGIYQDMLKSGELAQRREALAYF